MLIKHLDQMLICSGGDGLEQPLQTPTLQFLDRPTCSLIVGELFFDGKRVLQNELSTLNRRFDNNGIPDDWEDEPRPLGMLEVR
jgi:hypothetical protein